MNMAMTADGKITSARREYPRFTAPADRKRMDRIRAEADAIMVGAGTLRADDPPLHIRDPEMRAYRRSLGKPEGLLYVFVSASAHIPPDARALHDPHAVGKILATVENAPPERLERLADLVEIWKVGTHRVDLPELLRGLRARNVERVLVEGGGELNWGFVRDGLLDELYVTVAPALLGGRDAPTLLEGEGFPMDRQVRLRLADLDREGDEIFCRYEVLR